LKNQYVVELIRGAVLWIVWLERNRLCFANKGKPKHVTVTGMQIISLARYWCGIKGKTNLLHLSIILPQDVEVLSLQVQDLTEGMSEEEGSKETLMRDMVDTQVALEVPMFERETDETFLV
jgi:hypothetical protein